MMKKLLVLLFIPLFALTACEGPQGPPGPPGFDGVDGLDGLDAPLPSVFEEVVSFDYDADLNTWFSPILEYNGTVDGDIFLVYIDLGNSLFTPLPASFFDEFGTYQYTFDHDFESVQMQIIGDNDLSTLDLNSTENVLFRVAIIPAVLSEDFNASDFKSFESFMAAFDLSTEDITIRN
ncbi:hypothetical protein [Croceiramulus getboli]|nr:hypothetical protein P8624_12500 [Flavobacteriaceae bacterium YJPT1-3]